MSSPISLPVLVIKSYSPLLLFKKILQTSKHYNFFSSFFKIFIYLFIYYLWLCWVFVSVRGLSLVVASRGHSSSRYAGLSLSRPLLLRSIGSRRAGSVIVVHGPSRSAACGIFPDQGSNPCPLHWQADSQPLRHQGSPSFLFLINLFYVFIFGCVGSLLLCTCFLQLWQAGVDLCCCVRASHCGGFSCCGAWALGMRASVVAARRLSSCGSRALERRFSSCGAGAQLLRGMWDLPRPGNQTCVLCIGRQILNH